MEGVFVFLGHAILDIQESRFKSVNLSMDDISQIWICINLESASPIFQSTHPHKLDLPQHSHIWLLIKLFGFVVLFPSIQLVHPLKVPRCYIRPWWIIWKMNVFKIHDYLTFSLMPASAFSSYNPIAWVVKRYKLNSKKDVLWNTLVQILHSFCST